MTAGAVVPVSGASGWRHEPVPFTICSHCLNATWHSTSTDVTVIEHAPDGEVHDSCAPPLSVERTCNDASVYVPVDMGTAPVNVAVT